MPPHSRVLGYDVREDRDGSAMARPLVLALLAAVGICLAATTVLSMQQHSENRRSDAPPNAQREGPRVDEQRPDTPPPPPFPLRRRVAPWPADLAWVNTDRPIRLRELKGKFVVIDFWTYCCINCMHVLPELKKLERAYPNEVVVIGVHSPKFKAERDDANVREAIARYEIEHAVVNDTGYRLWKAMDVHAWPTLVVIDPEGLAVLKHSGEFRFEQLDAMLQRALPYYRQRGLLDGKPLRMKIGLSPRAPTPLRFPGKVLADGDHGRLFIADGNHNRIVVATLDGQWIDTVGTGEPGHKDGAFDQAAFNHPQGMALKWPTLYVADTENHRIRAVDLTARRVTTVAGTGKQATNGWPEPSELSEPSEPSEFPERPSRHRWGGPPLRTALSSPWALWVHDGRLLIAMAGSHQIWSMQLDGTRVGPFAGNAREDIVDGPLLPPAPFALGAASFAQPSGLASDGRRLFVADSEGSSIRSVPLDGPGPVETLVGTASLSGARLFTFGYRDGPGSQAQFQHPLGVAYHQGQIYVADTYNDCVRAIDLDRNEVRTVAGGTAIRENTAGLDDERQPAKPFDEPTGISYAGGRLYVADTNNHRIRVIDLDDDNAVRTLAIRGLAPPQSSKTPRPEAIAP